MERSTIGRRTPAMPATNAVGGEGLSAAQRRVPQRQSVAGPRTLVLFPREQRRSGTTAMLRATAGSSALTPLRDRRCLGFSAKAPCPTRTRQGPSRHKTGRSGCPSARWQDTKHVESEVLQSIQTCDAGRGAPCELLALDPVERASGTTRVRPLSGTRLVALDRAVTATDRG